MASENAMRMPDYRKSLKNRFKSFKYRAYFRAHFPDEFCRCFCCFIFWVWKSIFKTIGL